MLWVGMVVRACVRELARASARVCGCACMRSLTNACTRAYVRMRAHARTRSAVRIRVCHVRVHARLCLYVFKAAARRSSLIPRLFRERHPKAIPHEQHISLRRILIVLQLRATSLIPAL